MSGVVCVSRWVSSLSAIIFFAPALLNLLMRGGDEHLDAWSVSASLLCGVAKGMITRSFFSWTIRSLVIRSFLNCLVCEFVVLIVSLLAKWIRQKGLGLHINE